MANTALKQRPARTKTLAQEIEALDRQWQRENRNSTPVLRPTLVRRAKHKPSYKGSMYLSKFTRTKLLRERVALAIQALRPWVDHFDAIAFSGMSGAIISPPVAISLDKELIMVRKRGPNGSRSSHSTHFVEGDIGARNYIILDDFIDSGKTRNYIKSMISSENAHANCLGLLQVNHLDADTLNDFERRHVPYPLAQ